MSIADKLAIITENQQKVYEAGQKSEYDKFWDNYQNNGDSANFVYAFAGPRWTDNVYNPKYDFMIPSGNNSCNSMYYYSNITDTIKPLKGITGSNGHLFASSKLVNIRSVEVDDTATFSNWFADTKSLKEIRFKGTIGNDINFSSCSLLSRDSMDNIFDHLKDFTVWTETTKNAWSRADGLTSIKIVLADGVENANISYTRNYPETSLSYNETFDKELKINLYSEETVQVDFIWDSNNNNLASDQYTIYEGVRDSSTQALTLKEDAVNKAYEQSEWTDKVVEANYKGWTIEKS